MKRRLKSIIVVSVFAVGLAFPVVPHAERGAEMRSLPVDHELDTKGLAVGLWGGKHISLEVTKHGAMVEYDCAHGTISRRVFLDRRGRFDVSGQHVEERGGPVGENEQLNSYPVRFTGRINGKHMKLIVRNSITKRLVGIFTLIYGKDPDLIKCR